MVVKTSSSRLEIGLGDEALELRIEVDDEGVTRLTDLAARPDRLVTGVGTAMIGHGRRAAGDQG